MSQSRFTRQQHDLLTSAQNTSIRTTPTLLRSRVASDANSEPYNSLPLDPKGEQSFNGGLLLSTPDQFEPEIALKRILSSPERL